MRKILSLLLVAAFVCAPSVWAYGNPTKIKASVLMGYDNNPGLNAERDEDFFALESADVSFKNPLSREIRLRLLYNVFNVNYFDAGEEDLLYQTAGAGLDFKIAPDTVLEADYEFKYVYYYDDDLSTYYANRGRVGLKQRVTRDILIKGGFGVEDRSYDDRNIRLTNGFLSPDDERGDFRYIADAEIRVRARRNLIWQLGFTYYENNSDDEFFDFYDYESYRGTIGAYLKLMPKLGARLKFYYENRDYDGRPLIDNAAERQNDDIYVATGGLFYEINRQMTLGAVYTYRQRDSNEPSQSYSGSIATVGLYFTF